MKINTNKFKLYVDKALKGCGNNNLLPLTSMIGIQSLEGVGLMFVTGDGTNTLMTILEDIDIKEEINITLQADQFGRLISRLTSKEIELSVEKDTLLIKANGKYQLPLVVDEEGLVVYPIPKKFNDLSKEKENSIKTEAISSIYHVNRPSLATTFENPFLTGYYIDNDLVISSDADVITFNELNLNLDATLLNAQVINLLTNFTEDNNITFRKDNSGNILFTSTNMRLITKEVEGLNEYPVEDMKVYLKESFPSMCKVSKQFLLEALDRLSIFIEQYDKNGAYFNFGRRGITVSSKKSSSVENIPYKESKNFSQFVCCVDIPQIKTQLGAYPEDMVEIHYGLENAIRLSCGKVNQIISLLEDDDLDA